MKKSKLFILIFSITTINFQLLTFNSNSQSIAVGQGFTLALCSDSTIKAWGYNYFGAFGDSTNTSSSVPVSGNPLTGVIAVAAGDNHALALKADGTLWAWGFNSYGQLGNGTAASSNFPVQIALPNVIAIGGGNNYSIALKNDGTVWAWGYNMASELGDGTTATRYAPVQVSLLSGITAISVGSNANNVALKNDGSLWFWGLGINPFTHIPLKDPLITDIMKITLGGHLFATKYDGSVWLKGGNGNGQLGDGTTTTAYVAKPDSAIGLVYSIVAAENHSLAIKNDSTVLVWGDNYLGELGLGTTTDSNVPVPLIALSSVTSVAGGVSRSFFLKSDGTLWGAGRNIFGQLGVGDTLDRNIPTQVIGICPLETSSICISHYTTAYDSVLNTFNLTIDPITTTLATSYHWDFGDGTTSTLATPTHVYAVDSLYNVCVKIYTASGDSCMFCHIIGKDSAGNIVRTTGFSLNVHPTDITTGVSQNYVDEPSMRISPNPSTGIFNITVGNRQRAESGQLSVYNVVGEKVYLKDTRSLDTIIIDLSDQPNGIYFLQWKTETNNIIEKIVMNK